MDAFSDRGAVLTHSAERFADRFEELLREHGPALRRVASGYELDAARREDLFQEICLALWRALPRFRGECSERTFVYRVAHNRGLTHRARRPRETAADLEAAEQIPDPAAGPETAARDGERRARLRAAVAGLPHGLRQVLTLTLEGLTPREVSAVVGISENNVAVRLTRARRLLREALSGPGGAP